MILKQQTPTLDPRWIHGLLLLGWIFLGLGLRLTNLAAKPPWMDEIATVVYSLGNGAGDLPVNQLFSLETLLEPLRLDPTLNQAELVHSLLTEVPHPPSYFMLSHYWMRGVELVEGLVSVSSTRTLPVLFGVMTIPATYVLGALACRSAVVGHLSALLMAVSPFGIAYSQETRHYSLAILCVTLSLICLVLAIQRLSDHRPLSLALSLSWMVINSIGVSVHLFFVLTLLAEALALIFLGWQHHRYRLSGWSSGPWLSLYGAALGTALGTLIWLDFVVDRQRFIGQLTVDYFTLLYWINPLAQALVACLTMIMLLPVEAGNLWIVIPSGLVMLVILIWWVPLLIKSLKLWWQEYRYPELQGILNFTGLALLIFFILSYILAFDITRGLRYNFVYFPGVIVVVGAGLAPYWQLPSPHPGLKWLQPGPRVVITLVLVGLLSGLTVVSDLGYRKFFRSDEFLAVVHDYSTDTVLLASRVARPDAIGVYGNDLMSLGWDIERQGDQWQHQTQFLLVEVQDTPGTQAVLDQAISQLEIPSDLWLLYFGDDVEAIVAEHGCTPKPPFDRGFLAGFSFQHFVCGTTLDPAAQL